MLHAHHCCCFLSVNCAEFLSKEESQVPADEVFFYRSVSSFSSLFLFFFFFTSTNLVCFLYSFFKKKQQEKQSRGPRGDNDNESVEEVDDDEFEKILGEKKHVYGDFYLEFIYFLF